MDAAASPAPPPTAPAPSPAAPSPAASLDPAAAATQADAAPTARPALRLRPATITLELAALVVIAGGLYFARPILLPLVIALLLSVLLSPAVAGLKRLRLPEPAGAAIVMVLLAAVVAGVVVHLYEPAQRWVEMSEADMRALRAKLRALVRPVEVVKDATDKVTGAAESSASDRPREVVIERRSLLGVIGQTQAIVVGIVSGTILLYFLLASGDLFLRKLVRVLPRLRDKKRAVEITRTIKTEIARYFATITAVNIALGIVTALAMRYLGMPNPALWGVLVATLNFIPYLGPATSLGILTFAAAVSFDTVGEIVAVPLTFAAITFVEGQVVQPIVIGRRLAINPVVIFLAVMLWGWLWGIGGVLVAVPVLVALKICADHVPGWEPLSEFIGRE